MPDWKLAETGPTTVETLALEEEVAAHRQMAELVNEAYADLERLYAEDKGWQQLGAEKSQFTTEGRKQIAALADLAATGNALIKRGLNLRVAYIWGQGVTASIDDDGAEGQDVNAVWEAFWDEPSNRRELTSSEAQVRYERRLATGGEAFWAFPTDPMTGRVRVRRIPADEIKDRVCDPEDAATVWFYKRVWTAVTVNRATGEKGHEDRTTYYPALGYYPPVRARVWDGKEVRWDAPMRPVTVNTPDKDWRGLGDVLPALPWARMDKEFLEDLAVYMRALTRILGQVTTKSGRAAAAARAAVAGASAPTHPGAVAPGSQAGGWAITDPSTTVSMVSKAGAQIDSDSSKPFAARAAAAMEVPVTMLISDPGTTGARAVAETLDTPTEGMAGLRRKVHEALFRDVADYVIDMAVVAPRGPLRGAVTRDGDRLVVTLPDGDSRTVTVAWPEFDSTPVTDQVAAVVAADGAEVLPPLLVFKLLATILKVDDIDDYVDALTDDDGNWIGPDRLAAETAVEAHRRGEDPAGVL